MTQITPVPDYLRRCANTHSPDSALLDSLAAVYLGAESRLHAVSLRNTLISAVARAMNPGCQVESACVLVGRPDTGKSRFWQCLAGDGYAAISSPIGKDPLFSKDELLQVYKSWIIDWEAVGLMVTGKQDLKPAQGLIVSPVGTFRPPFELRARQFPRPSIIVGTVDLGGFDEFPRSSLRLQVIPVLQDIPLDRLAEERDRIWAAACHSYLYGENWLISKDYKAPITNINHLEPLCSPRPGDPAHHLCWYEAPDGKCYLAPKRGMDVTHVFQSHAELVEYLSSTY